MAVQPEVYFLRLMATAILDFEKILLPTLHYLTNHRQIWFKCYNLALENNTQKTGKRPMTNDSGGSYRHLI